MFFLAQLAQDICEHSFSFRLSTFSIKLLRMPLGSEMLSCFSYHYFSSWHFWVYSTLTHLVAYLWHVHLCCSLAVLCVRALLFLLFDPVPSPDWLLWDRAPEKFPPLPSWFIHAWLPRCSHFFKSARDCVRLSYFSYSIISLEARGLYKEIFFVNTKPWSESPPCPPDNEKWVNEGLLTTNDTAGLKDPPQLR